MLPLVSILIPAYNAEKWIAETIHSAISQTWQRKEIIVVDDGSTDETLRITRRYEGPAFKVIHQENQGGCRARNRAFKECKGDFIQWLDADDLLAPDKIENQLRIADKQITQDMLLSCAWGKFFYRPRKARFFRTPLWQDLEAVDWLVLRLGNPWMMHPATFLVSRWLADKAGLWDERLKRNQDGEYFTRVVSFSRYVKFAAEARTYYRMSNSSSVSKSVSREILNSLCLSFELEVRHLLSREDSARTREACIKRLNMVSSYFRVCAPDLYERVRKAICELGGEATQKEKLKTYDETGSLFGDDKIDFLKKIGSQISQIRKRGWCKYDRWMAKVFGRSI